MSQNMHPYSLFWQDQSGLKNWDILKATQESAFLLNMG